MGIFLLTTVS